MVEDDMSQRRKNVFETFGNQYIKDSFIKPEKIEAMVYDKNHLCIGKSVETGKPYYLDLREACRMIFVGATRSGKTFSFRSMMDRLAGLDYDIIHLNDCKNEFCSSVQPVQAKFRHLLFPNEKPRATKVVTLRPTFFKVIDEHLQPQNYWFSMDIRKMTKSDFMTLMNVDQMTGPQKVVMEIIFEKLNLKYSQNPKLRFSVDLVEECIDEIDELNTQQIISMKFKFRPLRTASFYEPENERSLVELLKRGYIPAINLVNFENFQEGSFSFPDVILSMSLREIIMARRRKDIKQVFVFFDECPRFIGIDKRTSIKNQVQESVMLDTAHGIYYAFATQDYNAMPESIRSNTKYVFLPSSCRVEDIKSALNDTGLSKNVQSAVNDAIKIKKRMKKAPYSWLVINKMESTMEIITFSAPLSYHMETSN